ncbi:MAG: ABC transporter permease subunit [Pirellulales bacterium]
MLNLIQRRDAVKLFVAAAILVGGLAALWLVEPRVARLWLNTALLAAGACAIALPVGTVLAVMLFKTDVPGRGAAVLLVVGMLFVPLYLVTGAWDAGFGIQGWHTLVTNPHLAHQPWLAGWRAAIWVHGIAAVPWVVLIAGSALRAVEAEIEEDAATCASPLSVLWHITLPRVLPAVGIAALWIATIVLTEISVTDFFQVRTFAEEVYTQSALGTLEQGGGSGGRGAGSEEQEGWRIRGVGLWSGLALSVVVAGVLMIVVARLLADWHDAAQRLPWVWRLRGGRWPMAALLLLIIALLAGVPLVNLAYKAGIHVTATDAGRVRAWSAWQLAARLAAAPVQFRGEIWLSTWLGVCAASTSVAIGLVVAWAMCGARGQESGWGPTLMRAVGLLLVVVCLTVPGPLLGLAVIRVLDRPVGSPLAALGALYDSNFAPWLVQVIRTVPIATLVLWPALASVPRVMLDTAAMDGTGRWGQLVRIAAPQRAPAIVAAWLIAFAVSIGELAATILVMPPQQGATALSIQVFQLLHYGVDDRVAAICIVMVAAIAVLTGLAAKLLRRAV